MRGRLFQFGDAKPMDLAGIVHQRWGVCTDPFRFVYRFTGMATSLSCLAQPHGVQSLARSIDCNGWQKKLIALSASSSSCPKPNPAGNTRTGIHL